MKMSALESFVSLRASPAFFFSLFSCFLLVDTSQGNAWGWSGQQKDPPAFDAWSKIQLGWLDPIYITDDGTYNVAPTHESSVVYVINDGFPDKEYMILENRQPFDMDKFNFNGGLMVYHIDEKAQINNEGHPGQAGWPANGNHYACSILPRDGAYNLEKGNNYGDASDLFRNGDEIGPNGVSLNGVQTSAYPNTDSYQYGTIESTGHTIFGIDVKADGSIDFNYCNGCDPSTFGGGGPVASPTNAPPTPVPPTNAPPTPVPPTPGELFVLYFYMK